MASKYFGGVSSEDFSKNYFNIDTTIDIVNNTQKSIGQTPCFTEKQSPNIVGDKKETKPEPKQEETEKKHDCSKCNKQCHCKPTVDDKLDLKPFETEEYTDFNDELYICEYCSALGYNTKYIPEICDVCTKCECCEEYLNEDCEGCGYSVYPDGRYYSEKIPESELFDKDELKKFDEIQVNKDSNPKAKLLLKDYFTVTNM